jgi:hypothetical protein
MKPRRYGKAEKHSAFRHLRNAKPIGGMRASRYSADLLRVCEEIRIEMEIDSSFLAFPAQAGIHLSTAPKSGRNTKALPRVTDPRRGTMDPGLRRGGE